jgi:hypothetical protein
MIKHMISLTLPIQVGKSLFLLLMLVSFFSCEKDHSLNQDNLTANHPKVIDGVMVFDSELQLHTFLEKLDEETSNLSSTQKEDYLLTLQTEIGHQSLLFAQPDVTFRSGNESYTVEEIMAMGDEKYIHDEIEQFVLNENYEVVVENNLYIQQGQNIEIKVPFENTEVRLLAQELPKGSTSVPTELLKLGATLTENAIIQHKKIIWPPFNPPNPPNPPAQTCDLIGYIFSPTVNTNGPCTNSSQVDAFLRTWCSDPVDNESQDANWTIDFGDGNVETFDDVGQISTGHNYDDDGNYVITVTVNFVDEDGETQELSESFNVGLAPVTACTVANADRARFIEHPTRDFAIRVEIWRRQSILGTNVGGKTESWMLRPDARWESSNVGLVEVSVEIPWRWRPSRDDACEIESVGVDFDSENGTNTTVREWSIRRRGAYIGREAITTHRLTAFGNLEILGEMNLDFTCE